MFESLDRKMAAAARRAEEERRTSAAQLAPEAFERDNHLPDGTVKPNPAVKPPPLGPTPRGIALSLRVAELKDALQRYHAAGLSHLPCVEEWAREVVDIEESGVWADPAPAIPTVGSVPMALSTLGAALRDDPDYAHTWFANFVMAVLDECNDPNNDAVWRDSTADRDRRVAEGAARRFLGSAFGVRMAAAEQHPVGPSFRSRDEAPEWTVEWPARVFSPSSIEDVVKLLLNEEMPTVTHIGVVDYGNTIRVCLRMRDQPRLGGVFLSRPEHLRVMPEPSASAKRAAQDYRNAHARAMLDMLDLANFPSSKDLIKDLNPTSDDIIKSWLEKPARLHRARTAPEAPGMEVTLKTGAGAAERQRVVGRIVDNGFNRIASDINSCPAVAIGVSMGRHAGD